MPRQEAAEVALRSREVAARNKRLAELLVEVCAARRESLRRFERVAALCDLGCATAVGASQPDPGICGGGEQLRSTQKGGAGIGKSGMHAGTAKSEQPFQEARADC